MLHGRFWAFKWYNKKSCNCFWSDLLHCECKLSSHTVKKPISGLLVELCFIQYNMRSLTNTHLHTEIHTNLPGELVKWWNDSSFHGSLNPHLSSPPLPPPATVPSLSSISLADSRPPAPRSHFCNLLQLIESQWCENMGLWQRVCQGARSPPSLSLSLKP